MKQPRVCISPLDWGLGHATRCIPLIKAFQSLGYKVFIATDGDQAVILKQAFPEIEFLSIRGYQVHYTKNKGLLFFSLLWQLPKIIYCIFHEYEWLKKTQKQYQFDLIVSDNRFGFFHKKVNSVFITHQLNLQTPFKWTSALYQQLLYSWLKKFNSCWIPDNQDAPGFSGDLAHPKKMPTTPYWYMGLLSRMQSVETKEPINENNEIEFLGIVSGPEPQRSIFEKQLWKQGNALGKKFVVVAGVPHNPLYKKYSSCGHLYHHLSMEDLVQKIQSAKFIICRGGYTSLMELAAFNKSLILVPTPGQTEQAYLAKHWSVNKWAVSVDAAAFDLKNALERAKQNTSNPIPYTSFSANALAAALKTLTL
ncbi:MAG: hypothetical protein RL377_690 [Bacteroidota bacterium]